METKMCKFLVVLIVFLAPSAALADEPTVAFRYVNSSGIVSFTDEAKRVPAMYKEQATQVTLGALADYERYTPIAPKALDVVE